MKKVRVIGIDFGTSNSALGYTDYTKDDKGNLTPIGEPHIIASEGVTIPTVIIEKNGRYDYPDSYADLLNEESDCIIHRNFKMDFLEIAKSFNNAKESINSSGNEISLQLTKVFFKYLFSQYRDNNKTSEQVLESEYEISTIVTCPVRTTEIQKRAIVAVAEYAGFKNVSTLDEATTVMRFALEQPHSVLREKLLNSPEASHFKILIIDMGAGTTDMVLYDYCAGNSFKNSDLSELSCWPLVGTNKSLGGRELDNILFDYFKSKGYIFIDSNPEYYEKENKRALMATKKAKEETFSPILLQNKTIKVLGVLSEFQTGANVDYKHTESAWLDKEKFEKIIKDFACDFINAIKELFKYSKETVNAGDIDFVILSGGGSNWYFIREIILNQKSFGECSIAFTKVKQNNGAGLIVADSSTGLRPETMDLYGIFYPLHSIKLIPISWMSMKAEVRIYSYPIDKEDNLQPSDFIEKGSIEIPLSKAHQELPYNIKLSTVDTPCKTIMVDSNHKLKVKAYLYGRGADKDDKFEWSTLKTSTIYSRRSLNRALDNWWNGARSKQCNVELKKSFKMDINRRVNFSVLFDVVGYWSWTIAINL